MSTPSNIATQLVSDHDLASADRVGQLSGRLLTEAAKAMRAREAAPGEVVEAAALVLAHAIRTARPLLSSQGTVDLAAEMVRHAIEALTGEAPSNDPQD